MAIGNYKKKAIPLEGSASPTTAPSASAPPSPAKTVATAVETTIERDIAETGAIADKARSYEELLAEEGLTADEVFQIQSSILQEDLYRETMPLIPGVSATFRTRTYDDLIRFQQAVRTTAPYTQDELDELKLRFFLASSLESFRGETFEFPDPRKSTKEQMEVAFETRQTYIKHLPAHTVHKLCELLNKFDRKVQIALSEGAVEGF